MFATINNEGELEIFTNLGDKCANCKNADKCPLIQAIYQEKVILHYSEIAINDCRLYKR